MQGDAPQARDAADADTNPSGLSDAVHTAATHQQFGSCRYTSGRSKWADFDSTYGPCGRRIRPVLMFSMEYYQTTLTLGVSDAASVDLAWRI
jgi:hypothetical protein